MGTVEQFVVIMYDQSNTTCKVDKACFDLFARKQRPHDAIPPIQSALKVHVKRALFQAGHVWVQSTLTEQQFPSPSIGDGQSRRMFGFVNGQSLF